MSAITAEMEMELEGELEQEGESEFEAEAPAQIPAHEGESEAELEQETFFNHLAAMADRGGRSQALRRIGLSAAKEALRSYQKEPPAIEGENEYEDEAFFELEAEANPLQALHANSMMEHLSHEASSAESEEEAAEQFLPLIPLAAKAVLPLAAKLGARVLPALARKVAPHLTRGVSQVARTLFRSRATRPLLRAMPGIARKTMVSLARQTARGHHISPKTALRTLARQTVRTLGNPRHAVTAYRRSQALDRRYHVAARRFIGRPVGYGPGQRHWNLPRRFVGRTARYRTHPRYWNLRRRWVGHPRQYRYGYYRPGVAAAPVYQGHPGFYRAGVRRPVYSGYYSGLRVAGRPAPAVVAPAAACQCFRPVSCASCGGACSSHHH
jgi:hypothetical protein